MDDGGTVGIWGNHYNSRSSTGDVDRAALLSLSNYADDAGRDDGRDERDCDVNSVRHPPATTDDGALMRPHQSQNVNENCFVAIAAMLAQRPDCLMLGR